MNPAGISILVLVVAAAGIGLVAWAAGASAGGWREDHAGRGGVASGEGSERSTGGSGASPAGRRSGPISPWVVVTVALLLLGVIVAPRLLGVTFVFLPLLWVHRRRGSGPWRSRGPRPPDDRV